jgi:type IV secretion system protein VirD4
MSSIEDEVDVEARKRLTSRQGINLGRYYFHKSGEIGNELVYGDERHALVFGPTGAGKTTRLLIVNLLSDCLNDRSVIVIDPKGELAAVCAKYRHELGHDVRILDPFGKLREAVGESPDHRYLVEHGLIDSVGFDPLATLHVGTKQNPNPDFYDDAAAIGEALIKIEGDNPHWPESAQGLITGLVMWELARPKKEGEIATLENVRRMLTEADRWGPLFDDDGQPVTDEGGKQIEGQTHGLAATARKMVKSGGYAIASLAGRFSQMTEELASVQSTADTQTRWLLSERIVQDLRRRPGIDFRVLKQKLTTVFVILPAERFRTHSVWLRLVIVSALRSLYRRGGVRTMLLIDEMASLGHLGPLEDAFGLVRGYRLQIVGYLQDMAQLKALYKERWESFIANAGIIQSFAPNDLTTAEWLSKRAGQTTVLAKGLSDTTSRNPSGQSTGTGESWQQIARPRWFPHELIGFERGTGIMFVAGMANGVRFAAPPYYNINLCKARELPNPYYEKEEAE